MSMDTKISTKPDDIDQHQLEDDNYRESEDEDYKDENEVNYESETDDSSDDELPKEDNKKKVSKQPITSTPSEAVDYEKYSNIQGEGLIKTRAQREAEKLKQKEFENAAKVNSDFDVNSVWESLKSEAQSAPASRRSSTPAKSVSPDALLTNDSSYKLTTGTSTLTTATVTSNTASSGLSDEYIVIKRVYSFAGKVTQEDVRVHRSSAEAIAYLKQQEDNNSKKSPVDEDNSVTSAAQGRRKSSVSKRRGPVKRKQGSLLEELNSLRPKKLNTLEKSKMDWLGYVDNAGIKDELTLHNKDGYLQKQDFLSRVDSRLDREIRSNTRSK